MLRRAARVFAEDEITVEESLRWGFLAVIAARIVWDEERWHTIAARQLQFCREVGLLAQMVISVNALAILTTWRGDFAAAASLIAEAETIAAATGTRFTPCLPILMSAPLSAPEVILTIDPSLMAVVMVTFMRRPFCVTATPKAAGRCG